MKRIKNLCSASLVVITTLLCALLSSCSIGVHLSKDDVVQMLEERELASCRPCHYTAFASCAAHVRHVPIPVVPAGGSVWFDEGPLNGTVKALGHYGRFTLDSASVSYFVPQLDHVRQALGVRLNEFVQDALVDQVPKLYQLYGDKNFSKFKVRARRHKVVVSKGKTSMRLYFDGELTLRYFTVRKGKYLFEMHVSHFRDTEGGGWVPTRFKVRVVGKGRSFRFRGHLSNINLEAHHAEFEIVPDE